MTNLLGLGRLCINVLLYPFTVVLLLFYYCLQWLGFKGSAHNYRDNVVLITGSANGLGREIAIAFAKAGASLALWDIDTTGNRETQQLCLKILYKQNPSARVRTYPVDVTQAVHVYAYAEKVRSELGMVTILVANAGYVSGRSLFNELDSDVERTFGVNALAPIWLTKAFAPQMLDINRGHIVFISSILGMYASHGPITYVASKHASFGLSRSLRLDIRATHPNTNVSIHCICPYIMQTRMFGPTLSSVSFQFLVPIVSPTYVASQVLEAIKWRRDEVILPYRLKYVGIIHEYLLPRWLSEWLLFRINGRRPLDAFHKINRRSSSEKRRRNPSVKQ